MISSPRTPTLPSTYPTKGALLTGTWGGPGIPHLSSAGVLSGSHQKGVPQFSESLILCGLGFRVLNTPCVWAVL